MRDHLCLVEGDYCYQIAWYLAEEQDYGAFLGDAPTAQTEPDRANEPEEWECWKADRIARDDPNAHRDSLGRLYWYEKSHAQAVLSKIKTAFKVKRPLADWEKKALDAGWRPPKGWS
jgi:hypothetical protein